MPLPSTLTTVASVSLRCFCNSSSDAIVRLKSQHQNRMMICQAFRQLESDPQVQKPISVVWSVDGAGIGLGELNFEEESADAGRRARPSTTANLWKFRDSSSRDQPNPGRRTATGQRKG